jgi:DNA repair protein RecO (recombination protein O)
MNFGEADKILTILTERFGKIKAISKGVRKLKSKLAGSLEPFMMLDLQLHEGKTFYIVTGSVIETEFSAVHTDLKKTSQAFYLAELVDKFLPENQKSNEIFNIFYEALESIEKGDFLLLRSFELKIIEASGFHPELYECVHCKEKLSSGENFWDHVEGGVVCASCNKENHHGIKISDEVIKFFRFIEKNDIEEIKRVKIKKEVEAESEKILTNYIESILEREIKSKVFLDSVSRIN